MAPLKAADETERTERTDTRAAIPPPCSLRTARRESSGPTPDELRPRDGQANAWLYGITLNEVRRLRRNQRRRLALHSQEYDGVSVAHEPIDRVEVSQAARIAREVLSSIGTKKAEALVLADIHGYDCESIAEFVGVKTETVWSRLHYARREFAQRLHEPERATLTRP
jgi:RNA polymerase sigma factor (sigma-70 family)